LIYAAIAGLVLLYVCASKLMEISSYLKEIRSSAGKIQLETEGFLQRQIALEEAIDEFRSELKRISSIAESYDDEVLGPARRAHAEADFFGQMRSGE
jgi:hypothetical protein